MDLQTLDEVIEYLENISEKLEDLQEELDSTLDVLNVKQATKHYKAIDSL
jgi:prefoldin subunit 5